MYLVVCYDITDDRRRRRLCETLKGLLEHVQYSVFEGELARSGFRDLQEQIRRTIDLEVDTVRIYRLTREARGKTVLIGTAEPVDASDTEVVI